MRFAKGTVDHADIFMANVAKHSAFGDERAMLDIPFSESKNLQRSEIQSKYVNRSEVARLFVGMDALIE